MSNQTHIPLEDRQAGGPVLDTIWFIQRTPSFWKISADSKRVLAGVEIHITTKGFASLKQVEAVEKIRAVVKWMG